MRVFGMNAGLDGCGQLRHSEQAEFIPPGKAQDGGTLHPRREILRRTLRQLQHYVNGLQAEAVWPRAGQTDPFAFQKNAPCSCPELAQHSVHAGVRDFQVRAAEFLPHQHGQLPAANTPQLAENFQDVFLLNR